jgi:hypothetical protein
MTEIEDFVTLGEQIQLNPALYKVHQNILPQAQSIAVLAHAHMITVEIFEC